MRASRRRLVSALVAMPLLVLPGCAESQPNESVDGAPRGMLEPPESPRSGGAPMDGATSDPESRRVTMVKVPGYPIEREGVRSVEVGDRRLGTRPVCRGGRLATVIPASNDWRELRREARVYLKTPGGSRAVIALLSGEHALVLILRADDSVRVRVALRRYDNRWYPNALTLCAAEFGRTDPAQLL